MHRSLRASGRVTYFGEKGRVRVKVVLLAERPESFRLETVSPFEQPLDVMASDGARLWLLSKGVLREGPATPENLTRLLPLRMTPRALVDTLLGGLPSAQDWEPQSIAWSEANDRWVLALANPEGNEAVMHVDPEKKRVEGLLIRGPGGQSRVSMVFSRFKALETGAFFPRGIKIQVPGQDHQVDMRLKEVEVDVDLAATLFRLEAGPGTRPLPMDSPPARSP